MESWKSVENDFLFGIGSENEWFIFKVHMKHSLKITRLYWTWSTALKKCLQIRIQRNKKNQKNNDAMKKRNKKKDYIRNWKKNV